MKNKPSSINFALSLSVCFTITLVLVRAIITNQFIYIFYVWNFFLAIIPVAISYQLLKQKALNLKSSILLLAWLLFFPNAPYIVTDLFHFTKRDGIPLWFDLVIVTTAALNGLILGFVSLNNIEQFLTKHIAVAKVKLLIAASLLLCGFGVYLGRFLRFNSWDVFSNLDELIFEISHRFIHPFQHTSTWGFSFLFAIMVGLFYYTMKALTRTIKTEN